MSSSCRVKSPVFSARAHDPFQVESDPNAPDFRLEELTLPNDVSTNRLDRRESLLRQVNNASTAKEFDAYRTRAVRLLHSEAMRRAFRLDGEDPKLRDRYGRTKLGQSSLLAASSCRKRRAVHHGLRSRSQRPACELGRASRRLSSSQKRPHSSRRSRIRNVDRRLDRSRFTRFDSRDRSWRIRPHSQNQRHRRPRSLAVLL